MAASALNSPSTLLLATVLLLLVTWWWWSSSCQQREGMNQWGTKTNLSENSKKNLQKWCQTMTMEALYIKHEWLRKYTKDTVAAICVKAGEDATKSRTGNCKDGPQCPDANLHRAGYVCKHPDAEKASKGRCCRTYKGGKDGQCMNPRGGTRNTGGDSRAPWCPRGYGDWQEWKQSCCNDKGECLDWATSQAMLNNTDIRNKDCPTTNPNPCGDPSKPDTFKCCKRSCSTPAKDNECLNYEQTQRRKRGDDRPHYCPRSHPFAEDDNRGGCCAKAGRGGGKPTRCIDHENSKKLRAQEDGKPVAAAPAAAQTNNSASNAAPAPSGGGGGDCSESWATCTSGKPYCYWGDRSWNRGKCCKATDSSDCKDPPAAAPAAAAPASSGGGGGGGDGGKIKVFKGLDQTGESSEEFNDIDREYDLGSSGWKNQIASIEIPPGKAVDLWNKDKYLYLGAGKHNLGDYSYITGKKCDQYKPFEAYPKNGKCCLSNQNADCWNRTADRLKPRWG